MFNDALYFLEQAKHFDLSPKNDWCRWRYLRATILYSLACIESVVNGLIIGKAKNQGNQKLVRRIKYGRTSIYYKVKNIYPKLMGKSMNTESEEWKNFDHIRKIRNKITHYSGGTEIYNEDNIYGVNIYNAEKAIKMVRIFVKYLYELGNLTPPNWIHQQKSETIN